MLSHEKFILLPDATRETDLMGKHGPQNKRVEEDLLEFGFMLDDLKEGSRRQEFPVDRIGTIREWG